jgi:hypothetical protein
MDRYGERPADWDVPLYVRHKFSLKAAGERIEADFFVDSEEFELGTGRFGESDATTLFRVTRLGERTMARQGPPAPLRNDDVLLPVIEPFDDEEFDSYLFRSLQPTSLITTELGINYVVRAFERGLSAIQLYQLAPSAGRLPGSPTPNAVLSQTGENLPALVAYMQREDPEAWLRTLDAMRRIIPDLRDIKTGFSPDRRLTLQSSTSRAGGAGMRKRCPMGPSKRCPCFWYCTTSGSRSW